MLKYINQLKRDNKKMLLLMCNKTNKKLKTMTSSNKKRLLDKRAIHKMMIKRRTKINWVRNPMRSSNMTRLKRILIMSILITSLNQLKTRRQTTKLQKKNRKSKRSLLKTAKTTNLKTANNNKTMMLKVKRRSLRIISNNKSKL